MVEVQYRTRLELRKVNRHILAEALRTMRGVLTVRVSLDDIVVQMRDNSVVVVTVDKKGINMVGQSAGWLEGYVLQYYTAVLQKKIMERQGFRVAVQEEGESLRLVGDR